MKPVTYKIEFPDGSSYIGATTRFSERRRQHLKSKSRGAVNTRVAAKFERFPVCGIYVVACALSLDDLQELEAQLIAQEKPELNVNWLPTRVVLGGHASNGKPFDPYKSISRAARALGTNRTRLRAFPSYDDYLAHKQTRTTTPYKKVGPPDPRRNTALVRLESGWYERSVVRRVHPCTVRKRVKRGMTLEQALTTPYTPPAKKERPPKMSHKLHITVGDTSLTIKGWSKKNGVPESTIHARRRYGWSDAEAVGEAERQRERVGPKPPTQKQLAAMEAAKRKAERAERKAQDKAKREDAALRRLMKQREAVEQRLRETRPPKTVDAEREPSSTELLRQRLGTIQYEIFGLFSNPLLNT